MLDGSHTPIKSGAGHIAPHKNETDSAASDPTNPLRHMAARIYPITATIRPFLTTGGHTDAEIERIHQTWFKSVTLQLALGVRPYASDGNW